MSLQFQALIAKNGMFEALSMLGPAGTVETCNAGAERLKGYASTEIIGRNISAVYTPEDLATGEPSRLLACNTGSLELLRAGGCARMEAVSSRVFSSTRFAGKTARCAASPKSPRMSPRNGSRTSSAHSSSKQCGTA